MGMHIEHMCVFVFFLFWCAGQPRSWEEEGEQLAVFAQAPLFKASAQPSKKQESLTAFCIHKLTPQACLA